MAPITSSQPRPSSHAPFSLAVKVHNINFVNSKPRVCATVDNRAIGERFINYSSTPDHCCDGEPSENVEEQKKKSVYVSSSVGEVIL